MSAIEEILASLEGLPQAERQSVLEAAARATSRLKWLPSPGRQTEAFFSPADIMLYGGAGGGGKSDLGLGLAFTQHQRSLIIRRKYANLSALTERAIQIHGSRQGYNGSPPPLLRTDDGRYIQFAGCQHAGDEQDWQGHAFDFKCVGRGTPVLMSDGTYTPIESIKVGQYVLTLEGPRKVTRLYPPRHDYAVRLAIHNDDGEIAYSQDQSLTHEVLTPAGWASHDMCVGASLSSICEPILSRTQRIPSSPFFQPYAAARRLGEYILFRQRQIYEAVQDCVGLIYRMAASASVELPLLALDAELSCASRQDARRLRVWSDPQELLQQSRSSRTRIFERNISLIRDCGAGSLSALASYLGGYSGGSRQCGERVPEQMGRSFGGADGLICFLPQGGVGRPTPNDFATDALEKTPKYNRHKDTYSHPYTTETRPICGDWDYSLRTFSYSEIGKIELYDIEVEEVNHYITKGGMINKNCFDEATQFLESQVRFHLGWLRSTTPGQRVRAVLATNPPISAEGDWIISFFKPWLDITHPKPAKPGELRWYVTAPDGSDLEVDGPEPVQLVGNRAPSIPMSRTFIPAYLKDNPYLVDSGYQAKLDGLPEPLRSAVRDGNFMAARADADYQVIPTQWVIEAEARWKNGRPEDVMMTAMAVDIAQGGADRTVVAGRYGGWYLPPVAVNGSETPDGSSVAALVVKHRRDNCPVVVDMGGGYGGDTLSRLKDNGIDCVRFNAANKSTATASDGSKLTFRNKRAEAWWRFREALNPDQEGGSKVALPHDPELRSDLCAPTWSLSSTGILIESKEDIKKRLGRSTDKGDAVVMALSEGDVAVKKRVKAWTERPAQANLGYSVLKRTSK